MEKWSQLERERNRKPTNPWPENLLRREGQAPSQSRNSKRCEQYRSGREGGKNMGRRGRKARRQERKVNKQQRVNAAERIDELKVREGLVEKVRARITRITRNCEMGMVVSAHRVNTKPYRAYVFTKDGRMTKYTTQGRWPQDMKVRKVQTWEEMSSRFLTSILKGRWKPFQMKCVLDLLAIINDE